MKSPSVQPHFENPARHGVPAGSELLRVLRGGQWSGPTRPLQAEPPGLQGSPHLSAGLCFSVREGYKVRSELNITLEFRTSSENGVLLGVSSAKVDAIGLEIVDGQVGAVCPGLFPSDRRSSCSEIQAYPCVSGVQQQVSSCCFIFVSTRFS